MSYFPELRGLPTAIAFSAPVFIVFLSFSIFDHQVNATSQEQRYHEAERQQGPPPPDAKRVHLPPYPLSNNGIMCHLGISYFLLALNLAEASARGWDGTEVVLLRITTFIVGLVYALVLTITNGEQLANGWNAALKKIDSSAASGSNGDTESEATTKKTDAVPEKAA